MIVKDIIKDIVAKVSIELTPMLQAYDPTITGVHFMNGHPLEIINRLVKREQNGMEYDKYPLVCLFHDFPEIQYANGTIDTTLHIAICRATDPNLIADERYEKNFKPVLYPIYESFIDNLIHNKSFIGYSPMKITKYDRLFWGSDKLIKGQANVFNDYLDAIEITNLTIKLNTLVC
jgi:hypothetical protein